MTPQFKRFLKISKKLLQALKMENFKSRKKKKKGRALYTKGTRIFAPTTSASYKQGALTEQKWAPGE